MTPFELLIAWVIIGNKKAFVTMVDAYKLAMAQAGFPLREETFVLCFRKGGPYYNPFDLELMVNAFLPQPVSSKEAAFMTANGYSMSPAMEKALTMPVKVKAAPKGTWIAAGTPVLTVTGPSFLVSWLEHFMIMLQYPIQIATAIQNGVYNFTVTCDDEATLVKQVGYSMGVDEANLLGERLTITKDTAGYLDRVRTNVQAVKAALNGEAFRAFEVGLRAATCMQQHLMVLEVCREVGVTKTSNVYGAWLLYMIPVGTTGHEHQMRWGGPNADDRHGYRAIRDMRPEPPSYLFDTTDPMNKGIPAALEVIAEDPTRPCSMRFDSGDQDAQFLAIKSGCDALGIKNYPTLPFEDSYTAEKTAKNEAFCDLHGYPKEKRLYGFGGFFVSKPALTPYNRDVASAAYKLAWSAGLARMKFSGSPGKESIPGKPLVLQAPSAVDEVIYVIAQQGEVIMGHTAPKPLYFKPTKITVLRSIATQALVDQITAAVKGTK